MSDDWPGKPMVHSFSTGKHVEIFRNNQYGAEVHAPAWSPDGTRIVLDLDGLVEAGAQATNPDPIATSGGTAQHLGFHTLVAVNVGSGQAVEVRDNGDSRTTALDWHPRGYEWLFAYSVSGTGVFQLWPAPGVPVASATWGGAKARFVH